MNISLEPDSTCFPSKSGNCDTSDLTQSAEWWIAIHPNICVYINKIILGKTINNAFEEIKKIPQYTARPMTTYVSTAVLDCAPKLKSQNSCWRTSTEEQSWCSMCCPRWVYQKVCQSPNETFRLWDFIKPSSIAKSKLESLKTVLLSKTPPVCVGFCRRKLAGYWLAGLEMGKLSKRCQKLSVCEIYRDIIISLLQANRTFKDRVKYD